MRNTLLALLGTALLTTTGCNVLNRDATTNVSRMSSGKTTIYSFAGTDLHKFRGYEEGNNEDKDGNPLTRGIHKQGSKDFYSKPLESRLESIAYTDRLGNSHNIPAKLAAGEAVWDGDAKTVSTSKRVSITANEKQRYLVNVRLKENSELTEINTNSEIETTYLVLDSGRKKHERILSVDEQAGLVISRLDALVEEGKYIEIDGEEGSVRRFVEVPLENHKGIDSGWIEYTNPKDVKPIAVSETKNGETIVDELGVEGRVYTIIEGKPVLKKEIPAEPTTPSKPKRKFVVPKKSPLDRTEEAPTQIQIPRKPVREIREEPNFLDIELYPRKRTS